jgi:hypothetical protein
MTEPLLFFIVVELGMVISLLYRIAWRPGEKL